MNPSQGFLFFLFCLTFLVELLVKAYTKDDDQLAAVKNFLELIFMKANIPLEPIKSDAPDSYLFELIQRVTKKPLPRKFLYIEFENSI
jgi:hypothetical protein